MKKLIFLPVVLASIVITVSCEKDDEVDQISLIDQKWIESYEEKTSEEIEIYRPGHYEDFPPSWYRQFFFFKNNNVCEYSVLAPNDGHYTASGSWAYTERTKIIKIFSSDSEILYEFQIVEVANDLLKLKLIQ